MICEICKKKQAKLHITQVKDDQKLTIHICHECAQENGIAGPSINTSFSVEAHMTGSAQIKEPSAEPTRDEHLHKTCPQCGLSYSAFKESGRLGCSSCYEVFAEQLKPLLQKVQKDFTHKGKAPRTESETLTLKRSISDLRLQLKDAVRQEQFELAAKLRDQIRGMESELSNAPE
ncbi:UvrB/UvrC motif-containing protein [bacterium]|nr:UvrB/UvrC motif-containing protein [bacterium]